MFIPLGRVPQQQRRAISKTTKIHDARSAAAGLK
jgi:hypothetical protein